MKAALLILAALISAHCRADDGCIAAAMLHTADWLQTRQIARDPDHWYETNALLGRHPSIGKVNNYFALTGALLYTACESGYGGKWVKYIWIATEAGTVAHNLSAGIQVKW
ncbi:MAG: hypothetical protein JWN23_619 [Rhodocyclales bacterium]|nr:hypothetical protein [Rhodocyclales bacterium]